MRAEAHFDDYYDPAEYPSTTPLVECGRCGRLTASLVCHLRPYGDFEPCRPREVVGLPPRRYRRAG